MLNEISSYSLLRNKLQITGIMKIPAKRLVEDSRRWKSDVEDIERVKVRVDGNKRGVLGSASRLNY